jgi:hypothetical protein
VILFIIYVIFNVFVKKKLFKNYPHPPLQEIQYLRVLSNEKVAAIAMSEGFGGFAQSWRKS